MNRDDFPILDTDIIYFDNGATTYKPKCVVDSITDYYTNACIDVVPTYNNKKEI